MNDSRKGRGQLLQRAIAALAIGEVAYRLLAREPLRRALGMQSTRHA